MLPTVARPIQTGATRIAIQQSVPSMAGWIRSAFAGRVMVEEGLRTTRLGLKDPRMKELAEQNDVDEEECQHRRLVRQAGPFNRPRRSLALLPVKLQAWTGSGDSRKSFRSPTRIMFMRQ